MCNNINCQFEDTLQSIIPVQDPIECPCCCKEDKPVVTCKSLKCKHKEKKRKHCDCIRIDKNKQLFDSINNVTKSLTCDVNRVQNNMQEGCAQVHGSLEDINENISNTKVKLDQEIVRAKHQEAYIQWQTELCINHVVYNPEDRLLQFYHKFEDNECIKKTCSCCSCCDECTCKKEKVKCHCGTAYTLNEQCEIVESDRYEETDNLRHLFDIDVSDFLRDIFVSNAYIKDEYPDDSDGEKDGPILVIEFNRYFENTDKDEDHTLDKDADVDGTLTEGNKKTIKVEINLSKIWKLLNYYDKKETREQIRRIIIRNLDTTVKLDGKQTSIAELVYPGINGEPDYVLPIKIKISELINKNATLNFGQEHTLATVGDKKITVVMPGNPAEGLLELITQLGGDLNSAVNDINSTINNTVSNINDTINNLSIPGETTVEDKKEPLEFGKTTTIATINDTDITVTMPSNPAAGVEDKNDYVESASLNGTTLTLTRTDGKIIEVELSSLKGIDSDNYVNSASLEGTTLILKRTDGGTVTVDLLSLKGSEGVEVDTNNYVTSAILNDTILTLTRNGLEDITVDLSSLKSTGGITTDTNSYVTSAELNDVNLVLRRNDDLPDITVDLSSLKTTTVNVDYNGSSIDIQDVINALVQRIEYLESLWEINSSDSTQLIAKNGRSAMAAGFYDSTVTA